MTETTSKLRVNEIFYSIQGEGGRAGTANVFVRLSGCNLACKLETEGFDCDTEFTSGVTMTDAELIAAIERAGGDCRNVILTGGEPMLQVTADLIDKLHEHGFCVAIETNGTLPVPPTLDYVAVSPKTAEHTLRADADGSTIDELRYVRNVGQGIPKPSLTASRLYLSPAATADGRINRDALRHCIELVRTHPEWRLSMQQHKVWGVR